MVARRVGNTVGGSTATSTYTGGSGQQSAVASPEVNGFAQMLGNDLGIWGKNQSNMVNAYKNLFGA
jgi:hypothetical protein